MRYRLKIDFLLFECAGYNYFNNHLFPWAQWVWFHSITLGFHLYSCEFSLIFKSSIYGIKGISSLHNNKFLRMCHLIYKSCTCLIAIYTYKDSKVECNNTNYKTRQTLLLQHTTDETFYQVTQSFVSYLDSFISNINIIMRFGILSLLYRWSDGNTFLVFCLSFLIFIYSW